MVSGRTHVPRRHTSLLQGCQAGRAVHTYIHTYIHARACVYACPTYKILYVCRAVGWAAGRQRSTRRVVKPRRPGQVPRGDRMHPTSYILVYRSGTGRSLGVTKTIEKYSCIVSFSIYTLQAYSCIDKKLCTRYTYSTRPTATPARRRNRHGSDPPPGEIRPERRGGAGGLSDCLGGRPSSFRSYIHYSPAVRASGPCACPPD